MVEVRSTPSPTRTGERNSNWLPAHMRLGNGTGGRNPPRLACPSAPISLCRCSGESKNLKEDIDRSLNPGHFYFFLINNAIALFTRVHNGRKNETNDQA